MRLLACPLPIFLDPVLCASESRSGGSMYMYDVLCICVPISLSYLSLPLSLSPLHQKNVTRCYDSVN